MHPSERPGMPADDVTPALLLEAYANGWFPMGKSQNDPALYWFSPDPRGILPLNGFHVPRRLARTIAARPYHVTVDTAFPQVMAACAGPRRHEAGEDDTWINAPIQALYTELWRQGHAHSVECWGRPDPEEPSKEPMLLGGLYGVSLGGVFFGESMFSRARDASKIALATLVMIMQEAGYALLDVQYYTNHLAQFGVIEIQREDYLARLDKALRLSPNPSNNFSRVSASLIRTSASGLSAMRSIESESLNVASKGTAPPESK